MSDDCSFPGCINRLRRNGLCCAHNSQLRRGLELAPLVPCRIAFRGDSRERFWSKVDKSGECWRWTGCSTYGYGSFWNGEAKVQAHRFSYEELRGQIPEGLVIDHLCRNRACVRPDHLEAVRQQTNSMRKASRTPLKTHCHNGHPLSGDNVKVRMGKRWRKRVCWTCKLAYAREWNKRMRAANRERVHEHD